MQGLCLSPSLSPSERAAALKLRFSDLIKKSNPPPTNLARTNKEETKNNNSVSRADGSIIRKGKQLTVAAAKNRHRPGEERKHKEVKDRPIITISRKAQKNLDVDAENKKRHHLTVFEELENKEKQEEKMKAEGEEEKRRLEMEAERKRLKIEQERKASREALDNMKMTYDFQANRTSMIEYEKLINPSRPYYYH